MTDSIVLVAAAVLFAGFPFNPDDPDSGWSFGGYTDRAENVAFLARLEADRG